MALLPGMTDKGRLGFAAQLKFMQIHGRFPERHEEIDGNATQWLGAQIGAPVAMLCAYELDGRQGRRHRRTIRRFLGFRPATGNDLKLLGQWLNEEVLPFDPQARHGLDRTVDWCRTQGLEPPAMDHLQRIIRSTVHGFETGHHNRIYARLSDATQAEIDRLLATEEPDTTDSTDSKNTETDSSASVSLSDLKSDPGKPSLESLLASIAKLQCIDRLALSAHVFEGVPAKFIEQFRQRCATESIREMRRHPPVIRYSMVAMFCWRRRQQLTDLLLDLLLQVTHHLGARAEKKIDQRHFAQFKKVRGKAQLLFKLAETTVDQPDGIIKDVVYPVVSQRTLQEIVAEFKAMGFNFDREVQERMRSSYGHHYRRMLMPVLDTVRFQSNNTRYRPVVKALAILKANRDAN